MADRSAIEWTDASWNPIRARNRKTGKIGWHCEHATTGCINCYAEGFNKRLGTGLPFKPGHRDDIEIFLDEEMLLQPLRWKKPRMIFVCSMTDLFADFVQDGWIDKVFALMALCPQHTFQVLTKRAERMRDYFSNARRMIVVDAAVAILRGRAESDVRAISWNLPGWPLPNVWLGVSTERQQEADERIPHLLATPAAVRFISAEPLLGPIDLSHIDISGDVQVEPLRAYSAAELTEMWGEKITEGQSCLDWVIAGGESGLAARPMSIQWAREMRDQCAAAGVAFFFKQWGEWRPAGAHRSGDPGRFAFGDYEHDRETMVQVDGYPRQFTMFGARSHMQRVGKEAAGRLLDGVEHNGFPKVTA